VPTPYATRADLQQLGLPPAILATIASDRQEAALVAAIARADSLLSARYTLPLTNFGADLTQAVAVIAAYFALAGSGLTEEQWPTGATTRYREAIAWLEQVRDRQADPQSIADSAPTASTRRGLGVTSRPARGW
jgi:phage gp36-like protein